MDRERSHKQRQRDCVEYFVEQNLVGADGYRQAMLANDYMVQFARENSEKKFNSEEVTNLIAAEKQKHEYTQEKARRLLEKLKEDCETASDRTNRLGVIKELNRLHRLYGDEEGSITINQIIVSPQERRAVLVKELKLLNDIDDAPLAIAE